MTAQSVWTAALRAALILVSAGWIVVAGAGGLAARDIVSSNFATPSVNLLPVVERVESGQRDLAIELPAAGAGQKPLMNVKARGPGPLFRWLVFSLNNEAQVPRDFVLVAPWSGFIGSGVLWPRPSERALLGVVATPGLQPAPIDTGKVDAYAFQIGPGETVTYAIELAGPELDGLALWQRNLFDAQGRELSFFRGVVLGIATLIAIAILCLFIIRPQIVFPAAAAFAWSAVGFIALDFGYLRGMRTLLPGVEGLDQRIQAMCEAAMALGLLACLYTFVEMRRRLPNLAHALLFLIGISFALIGYAWFDPPVVAGLARLLILAAAVGGFAVIVFLWQRRVIRAQASLLAWCTLLAWTLLAGAVAAGGVSFGYVEAVLSAGLVLVLLTFTFTLAQFAFSQGVISSRFFEDSGRRALALVGAEQCVWDWQEDQSWLYVGPELDRALGLTPGTASRGGLKAWLELIHPGDRAAYVAAVEAAIRRTRGTFTQEFRLRRGDGTYSWYQLRARALPGESGRAQRCIGTLTDITTHKRSEENLLFDAVHDRVTGLPNRALLMDRLYQAMRRARTEENARLFIVVIDLDRFKNVNDGLGHATGDSLLLTMARRLKAFEGAEDTLARLPGDQFGLILNAARPERVVQDHVQEIRASLARPVAMRPREVFLTGSVGVAQYRFDTDRPELFLKDAEIALYEAKRQGRDTVAFFTHSMRDNRSQLLTLESDLHRALERGEMEVLFQPIARLADRELVGFEALLRWRHRQQGLLAPDSFLGLAEQAGIMAELGSFVMSDAARQLGIWQRAFRPHSPLYVSVNLSSNQLLNGGLVDEVKTLLNREDLLPGSFKFELTESVVMENPELSIQVFGRLKKLGIGIACDDFGTGFSSLSHLRRMPFETLKIDRSFINADSEDERGTIILESIVTLAHELDMSVVVEGVENRDQAVRLQELRCDFGQGFYFGEPMTAKRVVDTLGGSPTARGRGWGGFWRRFAGRKEEEEIVALPARPAAALSAPAGNAAAAEPPRPSRFAERDGRAAGRDAAPAGGAARAAPERSSGHQERDDRAAAPREAAPAAGAARATQERGSGHPERDGRPAPTRVPAPAAGNGGPAPAAAPAAMPPPALGFEPAPPARPGVPEATTGTPLRREPFSFKLRRPGEAAPARPRGEAAPIAAERRPGAGKAVPAAAGATPTAAAPRPGERAPDAAVVSFEGGPAAAPVAAVSPAAQVHMREGPAAATAHEPEPATELQQRLGGAAGLDPGAAAPSSGAAVQVPEAPAAKVPEGPAVEARQAASASAARGVALPAPEGREAEPAPETEEAAPAPETEEAAPAPEAKEAAPAPEVKEAAPAPEVKEAAPAPQAPSATAAVERNEAAPATRAEETAEDAAGEPRPESAIAQDSEAEPPVEAAAAAPIAAAALQGNGSERGDEPEVRIVRLKPKKASPLGRLLLRKGRRSNAPEVR